MFMLYCSVQINAHGCLELMGQNRVCTYTEKQFVHTTHIQANLRIIKMGGGHLHVLWILRYMVKLEACKQNVPCIMKNRLICVKTTLLLTEVPYHTINTLFSIATHSMYL